MRSPGLTTSFTASCASWTGNDGACAPWTPLLAPAHHHLRPVDACRRTRPISAEPRRTSLCGAALRRSGALGPPLMRCPHSSTTACAVDTIGVSIRRMRRGKWGSLRMSLAPHGPGNPTSPVLAVAGPFRLALRAACEGGGRRLLQGGWRQTLAMYGDRGVPRRQEHDALALSLPPAKGAACRGERIALFSGRILTVVRRADCRSCGGSAHLHDLPVSPLTALDTPFASPSAARSVRDSVL